MRSVTEHLEGVLGGVEPIDAIEVGLAEARGCVLAEDVVAHWPLPRWDQSTVDGYAVRTDDTLEATPDKHAELRVEGQAAAGRAPDRALRPGEAVAIATGGALPEGADSVVLWEATNRGTRFVTMGTPAIRGAHIRHAGADVPPGSVALPAGTVLAARHVSLLGALGLSRVRVHPRPRVVVLTIGDDAPDAEGAELTDSALDANGATLAAAAWDAGAVTFRVGPVPVDLDLLQRTLEDQLVRADLIVTAGGVSPGAYETLKQVVSRLGSVAFSKVAMQPGMAQGFGVLGEDDVPVFTLPGSPVSAYVSFEVFVRPVIRRMQGHPQLSRPVVGARSRTDIRVEPGLSQFLLADLGVVDGAYSVAAVDPEGERPLSALAAANALILLPPETEDVSVGDHVRVMRLGGGE